MTGLWLHKVIKLLIDIIVVKDRIIDSCEMLLDTWAINGNKLIVFVRPSVVSALFILADLLAFIAIDAESDVGDEDGTSALSVFSQAENRGLLPLELVVAI